MTPPSGIVEAFFFWGDGTNTRQTLSSGLTTYNLIASHTYPVEDECEYEVLMTFRINGSFCTATRQIQRVTSWRTDEFAGGLIALESPQGGNVFEVCEGQDVSVIFDDISEFNCNVDFDPDPGLPELPNQEYRWQQIVYNTGTAPKIPNAFVDGVQITDATGGDIIANYEDPRGVIFLPNPVTIGEPDRRNTLEITALGGFGPGFPEENDEIEVTIRYWNFCNPYDNNITDGNNFNPVNGDLINGDNPPVERTATVLIITSPDPPIVTPTGPFCETDPNSAFNFSATGQGTWTWYEDAALTNVLRGPGGNNTFNPVTQGPAAFRINKNVSGSTTFTRYVTTTQADGCISPPTEIVIRIDDTNQPGSISHPSGTSPVTICSGDDPTAFISSDAGVGGGPSGTINYQWQRSTTSAGSGFSNIGGAVSSTFDPGVITTQTWFRRRLSSGDCPNVFSNVIEFLADVPVDGGTIGNPQIICTGSDPATITNSGSPTGGNGSFTFQWESSSVSDLGPFTTVTGANSITFDPPVLTQTTWFRRTAISGVCSPGGFAVSNAIEITVDENVIPGAINNSQAICAGDDPTILGETNPPSGGNGSTYTFLWEQSATSGGSFTPATGLNTGSTYDPPVLTSTTFFRRRVSSGACVDAISNEIEIIVNPLPEASNPTGGGSVCAGNPAPDIVWTLTGTAPFQVTYTDGVSNFGPFAEPTNTFTLTNPITLNPGTYSIVALSDDNTCVASVLGGQAVITPGTTPPTFDSGPSLDVSNACFDSPVPNPELLFSLDDAGSASQSGFILTYNINGGSDRTFTFNTDASGNSTANIIFADPELDIVGSYTINLLSIESPVGCFTPLSDNLPFTVNPRPAAPTGPISAIACTPDIATAQISVDDPSTIDANLVVDWYGVPGGGTVLAGGTATPIFTPGAPGTYHAEVRNTVTNCVSSNRTAVVLTEDQLPNAANAGTDDATCDTFYVLSGNAPTNGGIGTWTIQDVLYLATFNEAADDNAGAQGPGFIVTPPVVGNWTVDVSATTLSNANDFFKVTSDQFVARDLDGEAVWRSEIIDISSFPGGIDISVDLSNNNNVENADYIRAFYRINGGGEIALDDGLQIGTSGGNDFDDVTATATGLTGSTIEIVIRVSVNADDDRMIFDNVIVSASGSGAPFLSDVNDPTATVLNLPVGSTTLNWTINSALGACPATPSSVTITRNPLPELLPFEPEVCDEPIGPVNVDLTSFEDFITSLPAGDRTVFWFTDMARTTSPGNVNAHPVTDGSILYYRVRNNTTLCEADSLIQFTVNPLPSIEDQDAVNNVTEARVCEDVVGVGIYNDLDLTVFDDDVIDSGSPAERTVQWFADPDPANPLIPAVPIDPASLGTPLATPNDVDMVEDSDQFFAIVTNTLTGCENVATVTMTVISRPGPNPIIAPDGSTPDTLSICSTTNSLFFQITDNPGFTYSWNPPDASNLTQEGGGGVNERFLILSAPNPVTLDSIQVVEITPEGCPGDVNTLYIRVDDDPAQPIIGGPTDVCTNQQNVEYFITSPVGGSTYTWDIGTLGSIVSGQGTDRITVNIGSSSDVISVVEFNATGCSSPPATDYPVVINPLPQITSPSSLDICSREQVDASLNFTSDIAGSTFDWRVVSTAGSLLGASVGDTGVGNVTQTLINTSGVTAAVTYEVFATSPASCTGQAQILTVTINSEPVGAPQTIIRCSDEPLNYDIQVQNINALGNNLPSVFTYTVTSSDEINFPTPPSLDRTVATSNPITDVYTNASGAFYEIYYDILAEDPITTCQADAPFRVTFRIENEPVGADETIDACSGAALAYDLQNNVNTLGNSVNSNFSWSAVDNGSVTGESTTPQTGDILDDLLVNVSGVDQTVIYTVTPTNDANNCEGDPFDVTVVVQSQPLGVNDAITTCSNDALTYDLQANVNGGNGVASTFSWIAADNPNPNVTGESLTLQTTSSITDNLVNTSQVNQDVIYTVIPRSSSGALCFGGSFQVRVTIFPEPVGSIENIVTCSNDPLNYDLQTNIDNLGNSVASSFEWELVADNPDVTGETLGVQTTGAITDVLVNTFATSRFVNKNVTPTNVNKMCEGNPITRIVEVQGEPTGADAADATCSGDVINYDLQTQNIDVFGNGLASSFTWVAANNVDVTGESTTPQTGNVINDNIINTSAADVDVIYTVTPTDLTNGCDGQPFTVTITVQSDPLGADDNASFCSNQASPINYDLQNNVNTLGNGVISDFTWQAVDNPNVTGESTTLQTGDLITDLLSNVTGAPEVVNYTVIPTEVVNLCEGAPFQVAITVESEPVAQDDNTSICSDDAVGYNLQDNVNALGGNGMNSNFTWEVIADNPNVLGESIGIQSGPIITDVLTNNSGINQDVEYRVTPQAISNGCFGESVTITVTVNSEPAGNNDTRPICSRDNVSYDLQNNINSGPLGNNQPANFTWVATSNLDVIGESTSNRTTSSINDVLVNTSGVDQIVEYTVTPIGINGCTGNDFIIEITVQPEPVGVADNSFSACSDETLTYDLQANLSQPVPSTFTWVATPNAQVSGESVVPVAGSIINDVITNDTGFPQIVSYTVSPVSSNGCVGDDYIINITIDSEPLGQNDNTTICSRDAVGYNLQTQNINALGNNMPSSFIWRVLPGNDNSNITGQSLTDQTGNVIGDILTNTTGVDQNIIYTVSPTENADGCVGDDFEITVRVISEPIGVDLTETVVCSNIPFSFDPQNNLLGANGGNDVVSNFTWVAAYDVGIGGGSTTGTGLINETLTNLTNGQLNAVYTITPRSQTGNCIGDDFTLTVPVDPEPVATNSVKPDLICSRDAYPGTGFDPQDNTSIPSTFTWTSAYETGLTVLSSGTGTGVIQETIENLTGGTLNATYTVIPTSLGGCVGSPFTITVRINPEPVGNDITLAPTCSDDLFNINPQENINGNNSITSTFSWTAAYDVGVSGGVGSGTGQISESLTNETGGILNAVYTVTPTAVGSSCLGDAFVITKPIESEPVGMDIILTAICSDDLVDIDPQAFISNSQTSSFTWTASYPPGLINGKGSDSGNIVDVLSNETTGTLSAVYTVTPLDITNNCFGNPFTIEQPITPEPSGFNEVKNAQCSNVGFNFDLQANISNGLISTFTWTATYDAGLTGPAGGATLGAGTGPIVETLENLTGGQLLAEYRIIPVSGGCTGDEFVITVPVNPEPIASVPAQPAVCSRDDFNLDLQSFITNGIISTYSWTATPDAGLIANGQITGSTNFINGNWTNDSGGQLNVVYDVTPRGLATQCVGNTFSITIPIDPSPVANDLTLDICSDVPSTLVASGVDLTALNTTIDGGAGNTVTWFFDEFLNAPIGNPADHTVFDQIPIYANVSDGTCNNIAVVLYNIQPLPQVVGQVILDANGYSLSCEGADDAQITVTVSGAGVVGPFNYELLREDPAGSGVFVSTGFVINDPTTTTTFTGGGANPPITSGLYVIEVTENGSGSNCVGRSFPIVVSDPFELSGGFVFGPQAICDGDTPNPFIELAPAFGGIENYAYQWQLSVDGGVFTDIAGATSETFASGALNTSGPTSTTIYTYRRQVTSGSCSVEFSNEFDVTVNPLPQGDFEFYYISDLAEFNDTSTPNPAPIPGNLVCEGEAFFVGFDFTVGTEPFTFDYDDGTNFNLGENGVEKTAVPYVTGVENSLTITFTRVNDIFGCEITPSISKTLDVINIDPSFTINGAPACSGDPVNFTFNFDADVEYTLNYGDGTSDFFAANSASPGPFTTPDKVYSSGSLVSTNFQVILSAQSTSGAACFATSSAQNVQLFANVFANVTPETTAICSGESILFQNNSLGVTNHSWFFREQGTTQQLDPRTNPGDQTFTFTNTTNTDPIIYEVVYDADNGNCDDQVIIPIEVYKGFDADFDILNATVFNGTSDVTLDQLSAPAPPQDVFFSYDWSFGLDATPQTATGYDPPAVITYSEPGNKTVTLTITNLAAQADGISCTDVHQETILIPLPPITAEFTATPLEGCSPLDVETTNLSVGAITYEWTVRDSQNTIVAESNEFEPIFTLNDPGDYTILLQTSYPVPNAAPETAFSDPVVITVFQNPVADFRSNQDVIFIPDQAFRPINNSSTFTTDFLWDWGDGNITVVGPGQNPFVQHFYEEEGLYEVLLTASTNYDGVICSDITSVIVDVQEGGFTRTPNAFTPSQNGPRGGAFDPRNPSSGGGINDVFLPITEGVLEFQMFIFDRWGNLIFESNDKNFGWDGYDSKGNLLPAGVYVYKVDLLLSDGSRTTRVGDVTLIR
ncbi:MAG: PKD-like domain-containing protein [Bacteroidota bacterium]